MATKPEHVGKQVNYATILRVEQFIDQKLGSEKKKDDLVEVYEYTYAPCHLTPDELQILQQRFLDQKWTEVSMSCQHASNMPTSVPYKILITLVYDNRA